MTVPTIRGTVLILITELQTAAEKVRVSDPVKYATLKGYQESLIHRITKRKA